VSDGKLYVTIVLYAKTRLRCHSRPWRFIIEHQRQFCSTSSVEHTEVKYLEVTGYNHESVILDVTNYGPIQTLFLWNLKSFNFGI